MKYWIMGVCLWILLLTACAEPLEVQIPKDLSAEATEAAAVLTEERTWPVSDREAPKESPAAAVTEQEHTLRSLSLSVGIPYEGGLIDTTLELLPTETGYTLWMEQWRDGMSVYVREAELSDAQAASVLQLAQPFTAEADRVEELPYEEQGYFACSAEFSDGTEACFGAVGVGFLSAWEALETVCLDLSEP